MIALMKAHRPFLTQHRLRRLALWTLTLLQWIAAILSTDHALGSRQLQQRFVFLSLPWLTRRVSLILIVRASQLAGPRRRQRIRFWRRGRDMRCSHLIRTVLGARLRRALRHKDACAWIAKLIHVLRNLDAYARPLRRRLHGGLTRLWRRAPAIAPATPIYAPRTSTTAFADSS